MRDPLPKLRLIRAASHPLENGIARVLDRNIQVMTDFFLRLDRLNQLLGDLLRITVLDADPFDSIDLCQFM